MQTLNIGMRTVTLFYLYSFSGVDAQWSRYGLQKFVNVIALDPTATSKRAKIGEDGRIGEMDFPQAAANVAARTARPFERRVYKRVATKDDPKLDQNEMKRAAAAVVAELSTLDDAVEAMQEVNINVGGSNLELHWVTKEF